MTAAFLNIYFELLNQKAIDSNLGMKYWGDL